MQYTDFFKHIMTVQRNKKAMVQIARDRKKTKKRSSFAAIPSSYKHSPPSRLKQPPRRNLDQPTTTVRELRLNI